MDAMDVGELLAYLKARDACKQRERWLKRRGYVDPSDESFALNSRTKRLSVNVHNEAENAIVRELYPLMVIVAVPDPPLRRLLKATDGAIWEWAENAVNRYGILRSKALGMLGGITFEQRLNSGRESLASYVALERTGIAEIGLADEVCQLWQQDEKIPPMLIYRFREIKQSLEESVRLIRDFYGITKQRERFSLLLNLRATRGALLGALASGWREPYDPHGFRPVCDEPGIQIRDDNLDPEMSDDSMEQLVREFVTEIDNAWGQREPRCYDRTGQV